MEEEYELVPLNPIRRVEKRLERLEKAGTGTEMIKELIEVVRTNQQIVDDVVKINSEMIKRVSELSENVSRVTNKIDEFISRIEIVGQNDTSNKEDKSELQAKIDKLEKRISSLTNTAIQKSPTITKPPIMGSRPSTFGARPPLKPLSARRPLSPSI